MHRLKHEPPQSTAPLSATRFFRRKKHQPASAKQTSWPVPCFNRRAEEGRTPQIRNFICQVQCLAIEIESRHGRRRLQNKQPDLVRLNIFGKLLRVGKLNYTKDQNHVLEYVGICGRIKVHQVLVIHFAREGGQVLRDHDIFWARTTFILRSRIN